jgi:dipeptidyl aminopeptidase/acylaminoacyl peptidase
MAMEIRRAAFAFALAGLMVAGCAARAQDPTTAAGPARAAGAAAAPSATPAPSAAASGMGGEPNFETQVLEKKMDDLLWYQKVGDIADVDKNEYTGPPQAHPRHPKEPGATNPILLHIYSFIPKKLDRSKPQPLVVFVHQGVHASLDTSIDAHLVRDLVEQGYTVVATDYRGSTGYGRGLYEQFDYGGLETDDVYLGMKWALERYKFLDPKRVGIVGWSHGGMITLMNIFAHPHDYAVAYAGVPVSDLILRLGYQTEGYRTLYSAPYAIGEAVHDDIAEYKKRSPVNHVKELDTPLLIHTNTNDEDVNYMEVEHLIQALKAEGKKFDYKVYENAPGGHYFNRMDTPMAVESRHDIYVHLAKYLHPDGPVK